MRRTPHSWRRLTRKSAVVSAMNSLLRIRNGGEEGVGGLARVETRVLHDDGDVGDDDGRVVGGARDRLGIGEVVEADVLRAPRRHGQAVRPGRLAIGEVDGDLDVRVGVAGVEDARGLVAEHLRLGTVAVVRDPTFSDCPMRASDVHRDTNFEKRLREGWIPDY